MGVQLDPGSEETQRTPRPKTKLGPAGCVVVFAGVLFPVFFLAAIGVGDPDYLFIPFFVFLFGAFGVFLIIDRNLKSYQAWIEEDSGRLRDAKRTVLEIAPQDGVVRKVGRLGGGGTHIIELPTSTYVIVIADNGLGIGFRGSYHDARAWAENFVAAPDSKSLLSEILFENITRIAIQGTTVTVSGRRTLSLPGWYHPSEPSHRAQVHRLIDKLGFVEREDRPGTYDAPVIEPPTDAVRSIEDAA